jgi:hypothetical protein
MESLSDYLYLITIYIAFSFSGVNSGSSCEQTWETVWFYHHFKHGSTLIFPTGCNENGIGFIHDCDV